MQFHVGHQPGNFVSKYNLGRVCCTDINLTFRYSNLSYFLPPWLSKLSLIPLLLLLYSFNAQAYTASTVNPIQGSVPYLTFDGGITKITTIDELLTLTLSDGTTITPTTNNSTTENPIELPKVGDTFNDIGLPVQSSFSYSITKMIANNQWGDDDGDGQGENGITGTGVVDIDIINNDNQYLEFFPTLMPNGMNTALTACYSPYRIEVNARNVSLSTKYGEPNQNPFSSKKRTEVYYLKSKPSAIICYVKNDSDTGNGINGPVGIWSESQHAFLPQPTFESNFPQTGANGLYFDLLIKNSGPLTWPPVTLGGITATMIPNAEGTSVRVTLTGPATTAEQQQEKFPEPISKPNLPQKFELVGKNSSGEEVLKYGFLLKQWFVNRGKGYSNRGTLANQIDWCTSIGYRLIKIKDVTNAQGNFISASPPSKDGRFEQNVGAGLMAEWGGLDYYDKQGFIYNNYYWTSDKTRSRDDFNHIVTTNRGTVSDAPDFAWYYGLCTYP